MWTDARRLGKKIKRSSVTEFGLEAVLGRLVNVNDRCKSVAGSTSYVT